MAQGIILAGGFSSRAKTNKMMLEIDGQPLLVHTINSMKPYVSKIILVTGYYDQQIRSFINEDDKIDVIETNIDHLTGEEIGYLFDVIMDAGASDVSITPLVL